MAQVITRFAPSPTGHLHIGGARTALFCWAFARRARNDGAEGRFMVRIEDTDQARSSEESTRGILEDLAWLGIDWDDGPEFHRDGTPIGGDPRSVGPFFQARRVDTYARYIDRLVQAGRAYPAFETPDQLEAQRREAAAAKRTFRYDRSVMPMDERLRRLRAGEPHVIRFVAPTESVTVSDQVLGEVAYAAGEMDDFVIRKADGFPTYHFAVVVDDELMGVTHILRAQEHLNNTPRHVALQKALGFRTPVYAHMPLIFNMDGSKMSKRDKAKAARAAARQHSHPEGPEALAAELKLPAPALQAFLKGDSDAVDVAEVLAARFGVPLPEIEVCDFRAAGYLPEAVVNFIALLGWSPGQKDDQGRDVEKFDAAFLARNFSLDRIGRTNARFDRVKLLSFNSDAITALSDDEFCRRWRAWADAFDPVAAGALSDRKLAMLAPAARPRCKTLRDLAQVVRFALVSDDGFEYDAKAVEKVLRKGDPSGLQVLRAVREVVAAADPFDPAPINRAIESFAAAGLPGAAEPRPLGMGAVAQPLRVALTGAAVSPPLGETLAVLGKASALRRIDRCLGAFGA